jgi:hypothetical protein
VAKAYLERQVLPGVEGLSEASTAKYSSTLTHLGQALLAHIPDGAHAVYISNPVTPYWASRLKHPRWPSRILVAHPLSTSTLT